MKKLPIISNKRKINKFRTKSYIDIKDIKPITSYKYEEVPSNISQIFLNEQSISGSTIQTNGKNINSSIMHIDHRYYSTINITKKFPLTRNKNISSILTKTDSYLNYTKNKKENIKKSNIVPKIEEFKNKKNVVNMQIVEKYMRKLKDKMNRTKFKLFKIVINNERGACRIFERKNNHFNNRLHNYLKSDSFYDKNKKFHRIFHFTKNDLNLCHDFKKHYIEPNNPENNTKITSNLVLQLLNEEDKKLISSDPYFFLKDNKYLYKLTNTKFKSLLYRLREEEEEQLKKNNMLNISRSSSVSGKKVKEYLKLESHESEKTSDKKIIYKPKKLMKSKTAGGEDNMVIYNKKYINKIINEDLNKRLKQKNINRNERIEKEMINTVTKLNTYKKKDYIFESNNKYYKTYNEKTNENFFKSYSLKKNNERLIKEELFHKNRNRQNTNDNVEQSIILKYQTMLEDIYKNSKEEKI